MINAFLKAALGLGAPVIENLIKSAPETSNIIIPRKIMSWVRNLAQLNENFIPGTDIRYCFYKTEGGWYGGIDLKKHGVHCFTEATDNYVASLVMIALEVPSLDVSLIKSIDVARLGKTIDLLVKDQIKPEAPEMPEKGSFAAPIPPEAPVLPISSQPANIDKVKKPKIPKIDLLPNGPEEVPNELFKFLKGVK